MTTKTDITQAPASAEPIYQVFHTDGTWEDLDADSYANSEDAGREVRIVYAAPVAQEPDAKAVATAFRDRLISALASLEDCYLSRESIETAAEDVLHSFTASAPVAAQPKVTDEMVTRFLGWKLPEDFYPDCGISFKPLGHPNGWPVGTNLLTDPQARAMLEYVLQGAPAAAQAQPVVNQQLTTAVDQSFVNLTPGTAASTTAQPSAHGETVYRSADILKAFSNGFDMGLRQRKSLDREDVLTPAARDVLAERQRQIEAEHWTPEHDDEHTNCAMAQAAACYALDAAGYSVQRNLFWPWAWKFWKPAEPRRNLVKAGALVLAEIERIDRSAARAANGADHD